jgi:hypothetical protein
MGIIVEKEKGLWEQLVREGVAQQKDIGKEREVV